MVKVEMPRGSWDIVLAILAERNNAIADSIFFDIDKQIAKQEY